MDEVVSSRVMECPWGYWIEQARGVDWMVKKLVVKAKHRLSLQFHRYRKECWIITAGVGVATIGTRTKALARGVMINIPVGVQHRIENVSDEELVLIETQLGEVLSEEDVVRLEDDYGRKTLDR